MRKVNYTYVPYHKMGFKILDEAQLKNLFPNYESLLNKIQYHREQLEKMQNDYLEKNSQYNLMYDNIFSILGKRGSGKTSAVFTIKEILSDQKSTDIILPIIMPEVIPKECSMIGWILSILEETVNDLDTKLKKKQDEKCFKFADCLHSPKGSLKHRYEKVKELCYSQFYKGKGAESVSVAIVNTDMKTQNSFKFSYELNLFWNELKQAAKMVKEMQEEEPLIYIMFDDVDLIPDRVIDLFSTIIKYLSHPNIIVIVTADEESLYDVVENNMNQQLGKLEELNIYSTVGRLFSDYKEEQMDEKDRIFDCIKYKMKSIQDTPKMYVDKILPPSSRYYLQYFDTCQKKAGFIDLIEEEKGEKKYIRLENFFVKQVNRYLQALELERNLNFLLRKYGFIQTYFLFCGITSRQIANACFILEDFISALIVSPGKKELYQIVHQFAYNILNTCGCKGMTIAEIKELLDRVIQMDVGSWDIFVNYSYLKQFLMEKRELESGYDELGALKNIIKIFVLLFFIENILIFRDAKKQWRRTKVHGKGILVDILDEFTSENYSLVCKGDSREISDFLHEYQRLLEHPEILFEFNMFEVPKVRNYFNAIGGRETDTGVELEQFYRENPVWFKSLVKMLFLSNEGIYNIRKDTIPLKKLYDELLNIHSASYEQNLLILKHGVIHILSKGLLKEEYTKDKFEEKITENDLQVEAERIISIYQQFEYYRIKDIERLQELIEENSLINMLDIKEHMNQEGGKNHVVSVEEMNYFLKMISNTIVKRQKDKIWSDLWEKNESNKWHNLYMELCDLIDFAILTDLDRNNFKKVTHLINHFCRKQMQYLYVFCKKQNTYNIESPVEKRSVPYPTLYKKIRKNLKQQDNSYLNRLLQKYVNEVVEEYVERILEG